ncbi:MAG: hypothetical protein JRI46_07820 [Deltaproteobacteria bacterium]|nr:hypothetical protein [Deltaproteobacteria bacterium]
MIRAGHKGLAGANVLLFRWGQFWWMVNIIKERQILARIVDNYQALKALF